MSYSATGDGAITPFAISAGFYADGTLEITSGDYNANYLFSGFSFYNAPKTGTITLTGGDTDITIERPDWPGAYAGVWVGVSNPGGSGSLEILDGATVTSINNGYYQPGYYLPGYGEIPGDVIGGYNNVTIGLNNTTGSVTVDGEGSRLLTYGASPRIQVGLYGGDGELTISNGGYALSLQIDVGRNGTGRLTIDGEGSLLRANDNAGTFALPASSGEAGFVSIGRNGGDGYLYITGGGEFLIDNTDGVTDTPWIQFGRDNGSYGYGLISGEGSVLNVIQNGPQGDDYSGGATLVVGDGGQGIVKVTDNAQINVQGDDAFLSVADGRANNNTTDQSHLYIMSGADVRVDSQNYQGAELIIGNQFGTNGAVTVDGEGSSLIVTSNTDVAGDFETGTIVVGYGGTAVLNVSNGATVEGGRLLLGLMSTNDGYGNITAGHGTVNITGGGTVTMTRTDNTAYFGTVIGWTQMTTGIVNVDGEGSTLTSQGGAGLLRVGNNGTGELNLTNGGQANAFFVEVGRRNGSDGRITVDGEGSKLTVSDEFGHFPGFGGAYLGEAGFLRIGTYSGSDGYLSVTDGGRVDVINDPSGGYDNPAVMFGRNNGAEGIGIVDGTGSSLNVIQTGPAGDYYGSNGPVLVIGSGGYGRLTVSNDATVNVLGDLAALSVARGRYSNGAPANTDQQSLLIIESGADVLVDSLGYGGASIAIGDGLDTHGAIYVSGEGSTLTVASSVLPRPEATAELVIGRHGEALLDIGDGGQVINAAWNGVTQIAAEAGSSGLVIVDGADSLLDAGQVLTIGAGLDAATFEPIADSGGDGMLLLGDGGRVAARTTYVGATGAITGDGTITGDVALLGGTLSPGASVGEITIDGKLTSDAESTILLEMDSFLPGQFDHIAVTGTAKLDISSIEIDFPALAAPAGTTATLVSAGDLVLKNLTTANFLTDLFGGVPAEGPTTFGGNPQAYLLADTGSDLVVQALATDVVNGTGVMDFGAATAVGVTLSTVNGYGTGTGGGFDGFALFGVAVVSGTAAADSISMQTTSDVTIDGRAGNDVLVAGSGDDWLIGGNGKDFMMGGFGEDTFILAGDKKRDTIGDFDVAEMDLIDVSAWGVTDFASLMITDRPDGSVRVKAGAHSVDLLDPGGALDASDLTGDSFIFAIA